MKMKSIMFCTIAVFAPAVAVADAAIDRVLVRQQWPWNEKVAIDFVLTNVTSATQIDMAVYRGATPLAVPSGAFSGDIYNLTEDGAYRIMFDPSYLADRPAKGETLRFELTPSVIPSDSPLFEVIYKIFDLENKTVTDVTRGALLNGRYGSVETDYSSIGEVNGTKYDSPLENVCVWTGVTNYPGAKTTKLVMRKIPAGSFKYGYYHNWTQANKATITVSQPFYIGVFELTQKQYSYFKYNSGTSYYAPDELSCNAGDDKPVQNIKLMQTIYGNSRVWDASSGALKNLKDMFADVGTYNFDVPTQAMWFRALRAGTGTTYYYDGISGTPSDFNYNDRMAVLGRFAGNGGIVDNGDGTTMTNGVAAVGSYRPNAFGLYDMIGNVSEATRDYKQFNSDATDPLGAGSNNAFGVFGCSWLSAAELPYSGNLNNSVFMNLHLPYTYVGLRLAFFEGENPFEPVE